MDIGIIVFGAGLACGATWLLFRAVSLLEMISRQLASLSGAYEHNQQRRDLRPSPAPVARDDFSDAVEEALWKGEGEFREQINATEDRRQGR